MAETKNLGEPTFPVKRKPDLSCEDQADYPKKTHKLEVSDISSSLAEGKTQDPENFDQNSSVAEEINDKFEANADPEDEEDFVEDDVEDEDGEKSNGKAEVDRKGKGIIDKFEANADPEDEEDFVEDDDEDEDGEKSNGKAEVDRKGKGIMRDDKGKGKLIEEDDDDSDDDSSDGGSEFEDGDSDLSDDPLAEVDMDNILPSRTRRRQVQPGVYMANDIGNDEEDDSDDSDALS